MKSIKLGLSLVALVACMVAPATADTFTFQPSSGVWANGDNWRDSLNDPGIPGASDIALIPSTKVCRIVTGSTEQISRFIVRGNAELRIEGTGILELKGDDETSTLSGDLFFVKSGTGCTCDPASAPSPGVVKVTVDHTISGAGAIEGGCDDDLDSPCLNPGKFEAVGGAILTLDGDLRVRNYLDFDVEISITDNGVLFHVGKHGTELVAGQLMIIEEDVTGDASFLVNDGKLQVDGHLKLTGGGFLDMGNGDYPEIEINATGCTEGGLHGDDGTLTVNANFKAFGVFHFGPGVNVTQPPFDSMIIEVASGATLDLPGTTGGTCP